MISQHPFLHRISEERRSMRPSVKSCESVCSTCSFTSTNTSTSYATSVSNAVSIYSSSAVVPRRTLPNGNRRVGSFIPGNREVQQRVLSARRLRLKTIQNRLADAEQTIAELEQEKRSLETLCKRYEVSLKKYESSNAELPKLLHSHAEELRSWQVKYRNLYALHKDQEHKMKQKDAIILQLQDQNKYLTQLSKDKNLEERHRLAKKLHEAQLQLDEKDEEIKMMARKVTLEVKVLKQQLGIELQKNKDLQSNVEKARVDLSAVGKMKDIQDSPKASRKSHKKDEITLEKQLGKQRDSPIEPHAPDDDTDSVVSQHTSKETVVLGMDYMGVGNRKSNTGSAVKRQDTTLTLRGKERARDASFIADKPHLLNKSIHDEPAKSISKSRNDYEKQPTPETQDSYEDDYEKSDDVNERSDPLPLLNGEVTTGSSEDTDEYLKHALAESPQERSTEDSYTSAIYEPIKEDFTNMRKKLSDDFMQRENFLDTFCRQASSSSTSISAAISQPNRAAPKANYAQAPSTVTRKQKMLAAYKAIENSVN